MTAPPPTTSPDQSARSDSFVHITAEGGHHSDYVRLFGSLFGLSRSIGKVGFAVLWRLVRARRVLFATLDDDVFGFAWVAVLRMFIGRKTAGLFLHPNSCFSPGLRYRVKFGMFFVLSKLPGVAVVSILPSELNPEYRHVATRFVHDPQFWDLLDHLPDSDESFAQELKRTANGRPILAFIGGGTAVKGYPFLADVAQRLLPDQLKVLVVAAGTVEARCKDSAAKLGQAGAVVLDRFMTDAELAALYRVSRWIWICYAPGYEQASGIFGRAVQYGATVVLRDDSHVIASYARLLGHPVVPLPSAAIEAARTLITACDQDVNVVVDDKRELALRAWRQHFIDTVGAALE
jgi:glycosyltransferase involved in cell wall biosynthesis